MSIIIVLILTSLLVALFFLAAFVFSVRSGQYEDTYTPGHRILFDDFVEVKPPLDKPTLQHHASK